MDENSAADTPRPEAGGEGQPRNEEFWLRLAEGLLAKDPPHLVPRDFGDVAEFAGCMLLAREEWLAPAIELSEKEPLAWEMLSSLAMRRLDQPDAFLMLSPEATRRLEVWALEVAAGRRPRPQRKRGPDPRVKPFRHCVIAFTVDRIQRLPHRSATSNKPINSDDPKDQSACHMVAERLDMHYESVKRIWQQWKPRFESEADHPGFIQSLVKILGISDP